MWQLKGFLGKLNGNFQRMELVMWLAAGLQGTHSSHRWFLLWVLPQSRPYFMHLQRCSAAFLMSLTPCTSSSWSGHILICYDCTLHAGLCIIWDAMAPTTLELGKDIFPSRSQSKKAFITCIRSCCSLMRYILWAPEHVSNPFIWPCIPLPPTSQHRETKVLYFIVHHLNAAFTH